jgi:membrane protein
MIQRFKKFIGNVLSVIRRPEMVVLPGQLAFFFVLSVVPIVTLITYGASFLHLPIDFITNFISKAFSRDVAELLMPMVTIPNVNFSFFLTLILGFYVASNGAASIIISSNSIYGIPDSGFTRRRIKAIIMTFIIVLLFLFILVVPVFGNKIIEMVEYVNLNESITKTIVFSFNLMKGPVAWFIIFCFIKILYTMAPDRKIPSSYVNYGAIFTTIMWVIVTAIYSYYINNFANYTIFYGGLANIVMLMLWIYLLATIFVIGMALNYKEEVIKLEKTGSINLDIK